MVTSQRLGSKGSNLMAWRRKTQGFLLAFGGIFLTALAVVAAWPVLPETQTTARVVAIYPEPHGPQFLPTILVVAQSDDGLIGRSSIPANQLNCKVGDVIPAFRRGV